jgi:hypothetical protein
VQWQAAGLPMTGRQVIYFVAASAKHFSGGGSVGKIAKQGTASSNKIHISIGKNIPILHPLEEECGLCMNYLKSKEILNVYLSVARYT